MSQNPYYPGSDPNTPGVPPGTSYGSNPNDPYASYPSTPPPPPGSNPNLNPYDSYAPTMPSSGPNPNFNPYAPTVPGSGPNPNFNPYAPPPVLPTPPPSPTRRGGPSGKLLLLGGLALLVILGGVIFAVAASQNAAQTGKANATATAQANGIATVQTSHNNATATVTALRTSHYAPFTNLSFFDSLTSSSSNWDSSGSACQFTAAGYQVSDAQLNTYQPCPHSGTFSDFAYQATMTITQGDCGGLLFRGIDNNNFLRFDVCQDGTYNIAEKVNGHFTPLYPKNHASSAIQQGSSKQNTIAVTVQGDTVNMYVNGQNPIDTATDKILTSSAFSQGPIALVAVDTANPTTVVYTNAVVWTQS